MDYSIMTPYQLGETRSKEAFPFLIFYLQNGTDNEKRLAASAISKLIEAGIDCQSAIPFLINNLNNPKPQVRQYTLKTLKIMNLSPEWYPAIWRVCIDDPKEYNREIALEILQKQFPGIRRETLQVSNSNAGSQQSTGDAETRRVRPEDKKGYVYFLREDYSGRIKIGATKNIEQRLATFQVRLPFNVEIIHYIESNHCHYTEKLFHVHFRHKRVNGEWFELDEKDIRWIKSNRYTPNIMKSINYQFDTLGQTQKTETRPFKITEKQKSFLKDLLYQKNLELIIPLENLSSRDASMLIQYLFHGGECPREFVGAIQPKKKLNINH